MCLHNIVLNWSFSDPLSGLNINSCASYTDQFCVINSKAGSLETCSAPFQRTTWLADLPEVNNTLWQCGHRMLKMPRHTHRSICPDYSLISKQPRNYKAPEGCMHRLRSAGGVCLAALRMCVLILWLWEGCSVMTSAPDPRSSHSNGLHITINF